MNLNSKSSLIARLRKGKTARSRFIESNLAKSLAYNLRATRDRLEWSQERLATEVGMNQNAISRLESPDYGKQTITTLKRLAKAMDVGLIVRFVPFSELIDWVSGTRRIDFGLATESLSVPSFEAEESAGVFDSSGERILPQRELEHRFYISPMPANNAPSQEPTSPLEHNQPSANTAAGVIDIGSARDALIGITRQANPTGKLATGT